MWALRVAAGAWNAVRSWGKEVSPPQYIPRSWHTAGAQHIPGTPHSQGSVSRDLQPLAVWIKIHLLQIWWRFSMLFSWAKLIWLYVCLMIISLNLRTIGKRLWKFNSYSKVTVIVKLLIHIKRSPILRAYCMPGTKHAGTNYTVRRPKYDLAALYGHLLPSIVLTTDTEHTVK